MRGAFSNVQTLAYSPNGAMLAEGSPQSGEIRIFNASTGVLLFTLSSGVPQSIYSVAFSHDGKLLAAGGYTSKGLGDVELWNVADGSLKAV
jgi:WD40 repeat protein